MLSKLHLCCGDIYLHGYTNIDICGTIILNMNIVGTTLEDYYKNKTIDTTQEDIVVDRRMDITKPWDFKDDSIDEIVMISAIEHFTTTEIVHIVQEAKRVLKLKGRFKFDYPDIVMTYLKYQNDSRLSRLIYGTHKNEFSIHKTAFSEHLLDMLFIGWTDIMLGSIVEHEYPMTGVWVTK